MDIDYRDPLDCNPLKVLQVDAEPEVLSKPMDQRYGAEHEHKHLLQDDCSSAWLLFIRHRFHRPYLCLLSPQVR